MFIKKTVAVYCSARELEPKYKELAYKVGQIVGKMGYNLVYGGGRQGLMGQAAAGAREQGAGVLGVSTYRLLNKETDTREGDNDHFVKDMGERKQIHLEIADFVVILPGGYGTLDELYETVTFNQLGISKNKLIIFDTEIAPALKELNRIMAERGTISVNDAERMIFVETTGQLVRELLNGKRHEE